MTTRQLVILVSLSGAIVLSGSRPIAPVRPANVLLISLDTTRADHLAAYGGSVATPALDRLARRAVIFETAYSVAPLTLPAHTTLLTGLHPSSHGVRDNGDAPLGDAVATLAEILRSGRRRTGAFIASTVLAPGRGLTRGFDVYDVGSVSGPSRRRRQADEVVDGATEWLRQNAASPFFLWAHLYDAHAPQMPPESFRRMYGDAYSAAIAFMDAQIGRLIETLDHLQIADRTVVIVVADHGESLGEHGEREHGIFLYEGAIRVPLIMRVPSLAPRRIDGLASLVDVVPTVLDLLGLPAIPSDGISLAAAMRGEGTLPERAVSAESLYAVRFGWSPLRMLRDTRFKFIDAPRAELYDLASDPYEERNLVPSRPGLAWAMQSALAPISGPHVDRAPDRPMDAAHVRALASLGYVAGAARPVAGRGRDPKDFIHEFNAIRRAGGR